jgi:hypothetical protein
MSDENIAQSLGIENRIFRNLVDDVCQVCKEISLVLVGEDGGDASVVELDVFVVDADEMDSWVGGDEGDERVGDDLGDVALW